MVRRVSIRLAAAAFVLSISTAWAGPVLYQCTFDSGVQGWTAVTSAPGFPATPVTWEAAAGIPGGALRHDAPSDDAASFFIAPGALVAVLPSAIGGSISWDISTRHMPGDVFFTSGTDLQIRAGASKIRASFVVSPPAEHPSYSHFTTSFTTAVRWMYFVDDASAGTLATQAQIDSVLSSATSVAVRAEFWSSHTPDSTFLDNVSVQASDPVAKRPVVIIPGLMGSELLRAVDNRVWLDRFNLLEPTDPFLFPLFLDKDGVNPDTNTRCTFKRNVCTTADSCGLNDTCIAGGIDITNGDVLNLPPILGLGGYTAYLDLQNFLRDSGGYIRDINLFTYGYDWRKDLVSEADKLSKFLEKFGPTDRVDIIAHSMGGLLIRAYLLKYPDDRRITNVIYLGTPQLGAPLAYAKLIGAATWVDNLVSFVGVNLNTETLLVQNFPTSYALLPQFDFVKLFEPGDLLSTVEHTKDSFDKLCVRSKAFLDPRCNPALVTKAEELHSQGLADQSRVTRSFGINGSGKQTLRYLTYSDSCTGPKLEFESKGDGVVPNDSASRFLDASKYFYVRVEHKNLPSKLAVQKKILKILDGKENDPVEGVFQTPRGDDSGTPWYYRWFSCSPIRTHITDDANNMNGLDSQGNLHQEIANSGHFVFAENEGGFIPFEKIYTVDISATNNGMFTLGFDQFSPPGDVIVASTVYIEVPISINSRARVTLSPTDTFPILGLDVEGDGSIDFWIPPDSPPPAEVFAPVLTNVVQAFALAPGISGSLLAKLAAAAKSINAGMTEAARGQLGAFLNQVRAQRGKALTIEQADTLHAMATRALNAL